MDTNVINRSNRIGLSIIFFLHGIISGLWFTHIPYMQTKLSLTNTELSMALLACAIGSFPGLVLSGKLVAKYGSKKIISIMIISFVLYLPVVILAQSYAQFIVALTIYGSIIGAGDVAMNTRASLIEAQYGKSIMSGFHAFWSISGLIAAVIAKIAFSLKWPTDFFIPSASAILFLVGLFAVSRLHSYDSSLELPVKSKEKGPFIVLPKGSLIVVSLIVVLAFISEGAIYDWGTLYLNKERHLDLGTAALGFGGFSLLMALGRMIGDKITRKIGQTRTVAISSFLAAVTMIVAVISPNPLVSLVFVALTGIGMANIVPVLFSIAGNNRDMDSVSGIAAVTMVGYGAFMFGPPFMGLVADHFSLSFTMISIMVFSLVIAILSAFFLKSSAIIQNNKKTDISDGHEPIERF